MEHRHTALNSITFCFLGRVPANSVFITGPVVWQWQSLPLIGSSFLSITFSASGASVVAIDNKIEQAMDLVKNHLMYAVREEVEVLKEQIKELAEKNNQLERENYLLKNLASPEQMEKFQSRIPADALLPLDNRSAQVTPEHLLQPRGLGAGSAV
uniref:TSC22 domain family protein 3 n=1 Tax=Gasterosteus aculeatus aculeatus TaxID=481459 RepID=A0AAQ4RGX8_GASAC